MKLREFLKQLNEIANDPQYRFGEMDPLDFWDVHTDTTGHFEPEIKAEGAPAGVLFIVTGTTPTPNIE